MASASGWRPEYKITDTDVGADINYACPCSCDAGFAFDRSTAKDQPEGCCCGREIVVGADAETMLRSALKKPDDYDIDVQELTMSWGESLKAALAIPRE
jgi:hypothetical protein